MKNVFVTTKPNVGAGLGHQFASWATCYYLARELGLTFAHQPFNRYEEFLGLGVGEVQFKDLNLPIFQAPLVDIEHDGIEIIREIADKAPDETVVHLTQDQNMHNLIAVQDVLREKYWRNRSYKFSAFTGKKIKVAVHIRRNAVPEEQYNRCLPYEYFTNVLKQIPIEDYELHVFSELPKFDFKAFDGFNAEFHIHEDPFQIGDETWLAFNSMVESDILLTSRSGFSYVAGIFSYGLKISNYLWWHLIPDGDGWIRTDRSGAFDTEKAKPMFQKVVDDHDLSLRDSV